MRILFIALPDSIHTARWIDQISNENWEVHLFPAYEAPLHSGLRNLTVHSLFAAAKPINIRETGLVWPFARGRLRLSKAVEKSLPRAQRAKRLAALIERLKPDIIHVLEMQRCGYLLLDALKHLDIQKMPQVVYSSWGSDMHHFGRRVDHVERVRTFLSICDYHIADCKRDINLAREFGFKGLTLGVFPGGGGLDLNSCLRFRVAPVSSRQIIVVKGYQSEDWGGRALTALEALCNVRDIIHGFQIVVYSCSDEVIRFVGNASKQHAVRMSIFPQADHLEMLKLFGRSRVAIGASLTDGTPNTMLEAMAMGAFPIQSDTSSTDEWIDSSKNGFLVPTDSPEAYAHFIRRSLVDDQLVNAAAVYNGQLIYERLERSVIQKEVIQIYKYVLNQNHDRERVKKCESLLPVA